MLLLKDLLAMSAPLRLITITTITALLFTRASLAQTFTSCNPTQGQCPSNTALGRSISVDFTAGASDEFTPVGNPTYGPDGVSFTVAAGGDAPQLHSNWYIMFGKYEITMKTAPGAGIVSSSVLQSDDLDEIDWEWLGAQNDQVQTNYFGKGQTTTYDRATVVSVNNTQGEWHTYGIEWTDQQIVWQVDGTTVRVLKASDANGQYPQTPSQLRFGPWSGGDPSNPQGTVSWSEGPTDYANGPFVMVVQSVSVVDYSTGSSYAYGDRGGSWSSIMSDGGRVNGNVGGSVVAAPAGSVTSAPGNSVVPAWSTPSMTLSYTNYPGLPTGWSVNPTTGKVVPPSAASSVDVPIRFLCIAACSLLGGSLLGVWL
ncbi:transglycosylase [Extremus antarcticus]|uniref:Transglycosylase n=1 Tax=Extremus antarcticus TaxID=702011 RepID=A0AAJ0GIF6_9PEZI|nr:transglycosylase [Extremus antarcticus]